VPRVARSGDDEVKDDVFGQQVEEVPAIDEAVESLLDDPKERLAAELVSCRRTPNGGAVAIDHPFGSSGTRYVLTLATELCERGVRFGVLGVCVSSGQGVALVLENPQAA
jgi:acetyl-CoA acetyltransferase